MAKPSITAEVCPDRAAIRQSIWVQPLYGPPSALCRRRPQTSPVSVTRLPCILAGSASHRCARSTPVFCHAIAAKRRKFEHACRIMRSRVKNNHSMVRTLVRLGAVALVALSSASNPLKRWHPRGERSETAGFYPIAPPPPPPSPPPPGRRQRRSATALLLDTWLKWPQTPDFPDRARNSQDRVPALSTNSLWAGPKKWTCGLGEGMRGSIRFGSRRHSRGPFGKTFR